ncbi:MAG: CRISPR-associated endonuclease Cas3'' [Nitrososphaeria archaeon]
MREILSYRPSEKQKVEFYMDHIKNCNEIWRNKYRERVIEPIARRTAKVLKDNLKDVEENVKLALDIAIIYHDFGKLTRIYQDYTQCKRDSLNGFRHEHISTYFILNVLRSLLGKENYLTYITAAAVYLHHEALVLTFRSDFLKTLRTPQMDYLLSLYSNFKDEDLEIVEEAEDQIRESSVYLKENGKKVSDYLISQLKSSTKMDVLRSLGLVLNRIDGSPISPNLRLITASFLLPIIEVDNEAGGMRE